MTLQEVRELWQATSVQSFEGQGGKFKQYTGQEIPTDGRNLETAGAAYCVGI